MEVEKYTITGSLFRGCSGILSKTSGLFFDFSIDNLPEDLKWWTEAMNRVCFQAKKGGTWEVFMRDFPRTLRTIGSDARSFRSYLRLQCDSLVHAHPNSDGYYPGLAKSWAVGKDGEPFISDRSAGKI